MARLTTWVGAWLALSCVACGAPGELDAPVSPPPDGTEGVGVFDTPMWGVVELDYVWQDGRMVHGGDVVLDPALEIDDAPLDIEQGQIASSAEALVKRPSLAPWPMVKGMVTIPFLWDANMPDGKKQKVVKAMNDWEAEMPFIRFVHDQAASGRRVRIVSKNQFYCYVSTSEKGETVLEAGNACGWHTYVHELGHTLGLRHEQLRKDRFDHVVFYKGRTDSDDQFCADDGKHCVGGDYLGTDYDLESIMHYPSCMLANQSNCGPGTPGKWVLETVNGKYLPWWENRSFGQVLSATDKCGVKTMFGLSCDAPVPPPPDCSPKTCAELGKSCGSGWSDGCGGELACGGCSGDETCSDGSCAATDPFPVASAVAGTLQNDSTAGPLCVEADSESAAIESRACSAAAAQIWSFTRLGQLRNESSELCARATGMASGAALGQAACSGDELEQFKLGNMEIVDGKSGKCLHAPASDPSAGNAVVHADCDGGPDQRLTYDAATRELRIQGYCLTGSSTEGASVEIAACDGADAQSWNAARGGFTNGANVELCLSVSGTDIVLSKCDDSVEQMWALRGQIEHHADDHCLSAGASGEGLTLAACDPSSKQQRFTFWSRQGCMPTTCADLGASCGAFQDDCGGTVSCGSCAEPPGGDPSPESGSGAESGCAMARAHGGSSRVGLALSLLAALGALGRRRARRA